MADHEIWSMLSKHLTGNESSDEKKRFLEWFDQSENNKALFNKVKVLYDNSGDLHVPSTFREKFTLQKIKDFILKQAVGNFVGFVVGMWVTAMFSHYVLEKRGLKNLFGLAGRKKVVVNDAPEWLQGLISILVGFIALELINHFFQTKRHLMVWNYIKGRFNNSNHRNMLK